MTTQTQGLGPFGQHNFTLEHPDDHILELRHEGELVARFSQTGVIEETLQNECSKHLVIKHGWDGCLWERKEVVNRSSD